MKSPWFTVGGRGLLGADLHEAWEFTANMDMTQIIRGLTHSSDHMLEPMSLIRDTVNSEEMDSELVTVSLAIIYLDPCLF